MILEKGKAFSAVVVIACFFFLFMVLTFSLVVAERQIDRMTEEMLALDQQVREQQEIISIYREQNEALGSFLGQATDTLLKIAYGPFSREEIQALIAEVAEIIGDVNRALTEEESLEISQAIVETAVAADIDPLLLLSMAITESHCRPNARGGSGEYGMLQIMPSTGRWIAGKLGYTDWQPSDLLDVRMNVEFAAYYLWAVTKDMGGDTWTGVLAYNAGPTGAKRWLARHDVDAHNYVRKVQATYNSFRRREEHEALNADRRRQKSTENPAREINPDLYHLPAILGIA